MLSMTDCDWEFWGSVPLGNVYQPLLNKGNNELNMPYERIEG